MESRNCHGFEEEITMPPKFSKATEKKIISPDLLDYQPRTSPCEFNCPAGNPIQMVHALIQENRIEEALEYLKSRNPFPGITGRVCMHPCELSCNRKKYDEGVSIRALERFAADQADLTRVTKPQRKESTGKKLAIIGSGPAGMTCAYFSRLLGHEVTVFESSGLLGGMPRQGIPDFRLPKKIVDLEIGEILELGVQARMNTTVGEEISFDKILEDFDACLIAVGTWQARRLEVSGADMAQPALSFLKQVNLGHREEIGDRVCIVGGGGVAFDCAFTAKRLGASEIYLLCLEGRNNMCASADDVLQAQAEGITIFCSTKVSKILQQEEKGLGIEYYEISSFEFDETGQLSVQPVSGEKRVLYADTVIYALGEQPNLKFMEGSKQLSLTPRGTLEVDQKTLETSVEGVFAAGDAVSGPSTVAQSIGSGRHAALAIDLYLDSGRAPGLDRVAINGEGRVVIEESLRETAPHVVAFEEILNIDYHEKKPRQRSERMTVKASTRSFKEINRGFGKKEALVETGRCLHCGQCTSCGCCVEDCPGLILDMTSQGPKVAYYDECWHCGCCRIACPSSAIFYEFPINMMV